MCLIVPSHKHLWLIVKDHIHVTKVGKDILEGLHYTGSVAGVPCVSSSDRDNVLLSPGHSLLAQSNLFRHCQVRKVILIVNVVMFIIEIIIINNNSSSRIGRNKKVIFDRRDQLFGLHQHQQHHQRIFGDSMIIYTWEKHLQRLISEI